MEARTDRQRDKNVINISVLQAATRPSFILRESLRVLRPGGTLLLLHVPKPAAHALPFRENFKQITDLSSSISIAEKVLIAVKLWAERAQGGRYWSLEEVRRMIEEVGFEMFDQQAIPVIIIHARKPQRNIATPDAGMSSTVGRTYHGSK